MPKISVIVPVYNVEKYLEKCLDSLVNQTLQDIEILVINDSTPDNSQMIIDRYVNKYPNMVKSFIKPNGGIASVRNFGLTHAQGDYIAFVDGDDYVELDMFEILYYEAKKNNANVVVSDFYFTYEHKETVYKEYPYQNSKEMIVNLFAVLWNKIYKRSYLESLGLTFIESSRFEDVSYLLRMAPYYENFYFVPKPFVHYVQRTSSLTASHNYKVKDIIIVLNDILKYYKDKGFYQTYENEIEYVFIRFTLGQPFRSSSKIANKEDRAYSLDLLWSTLNNNFPQWRKNPYLRTLPGVKNKYFRIVNKTVYKLSSLIFRML